MRDKFIESKKGTLDFMETNSSWFYKFILLDYKKVLPLCQEGELLGKITIAKPEDVNSARELTAEILQEQFQQKEIYKVILCISEAATNVIKYANTGYLEIRKILAGIRACIVDSGPGMDLRKPPSLILQQGFTTKDSLGAGFTLMYKYSQKVYLSTSEEGTILVLDFNLESNLSSEKI